MTTLSVLKFETVDGAQSALEKVQSMQKLQIIRLHDAAIVSWEPGKSKPKTKQLYNLAGMGALDGAFWGMLFGLIFFVPFFGLAVGAAMGALSGKFADVGIDDDFIKQVQAKVTEGTSALFLLTSDAVMDKVAEQISEIKAEVIATNLSDAEEAELQAMFSGE